MFIIQSTTVVLAGPEPEFEPMPYPAPLNSPALEQPLPMQPKPMDTAYPFPVQSSALGSFPVTPMPCPATSYDVYADQEDSIPLAYLAESLASRQYGPSQFEDRRSGTACQCPYCGRHRLSAGFLCNGEE